MGSQKDYTIYDNYNKRVNGRVTSSDIRFKGSRGTAGPYGRPYSSLIESYLKNNRLPDGDISYL